MPSITHAIEIMAPLERIHHYMLDIDNFVLPKPFKAKKNYSGSPKKGDTFTVIGRFAGGLLRLRATLRFTDSIPTKTVIEMVKGDLKHFTITSLREEIKGQTQLTETWSYQLPRLLERVLNNVKIQKEMEESLLENHRRLSQLFHKNSGQP